MHGEFLTMDDAKMAKSTGNVVRVADLPGMGYEPLVFRYLALTAHYRSKLDFTADAMHAAASGLARLRRVIATAAAEPVDLADEPMASYRVRFTDAVADDLALPRALALAHEVASASDLTDAQRRALLLNFDLVLGLSLDAPVAAEAPLPEGAAALLERRAAARAAKDFAASDALRDELAAMGIEVRDTPDGQEAGLRTPGVRDTR
jgi:cysteinyl-tRNA synthetase